MLPLLNITTRYQYYNSQIDYPWQVSLEFINHYAIWHLTLKQTGFIMLEKCSSKCLPEPNVSWFGELQTLGPKLPKKYEWQKFWKNKHQNRNKHIAIYHCTKFRSIWRTLDFGTKFGQKVWMERILKK